MISKKIHYCWLSDEEVPSGLQECINSWKRVMPDYEIILWDKNKFDIESVPFVSEACSVKKWAFAADYIRLYALYNEGGIYLDSDVFVSKSFDRFLGYDFFSSVEFHDDAVIKGKSRRLLNDDGSSKYPFTPIPGIGIQAAILGSIKGNALVKDCLDYYQNKHFILASGVYRDNPISPAIIAMTAEKYGFKYIDEEQQLAGNNMIFPSSVFASQESYDIKNSYAIHYAAGSWRSKTTLEKVLLKLKSMHYIRAIFGKLPLTLVRKIRAGK